MSLLTIPAPPASLPRFPRTPPHSYRFEVWSYSERVDRQTGSVLITLHERVWEEPEGRELTWEVPQRVTSALFWMRMRASARVPHVMLGWRSLYGENAFEAATKYTHGCGVPS